MIALYNNTQLDLTSIGTNLIEISKNPRITLIEKKSKNLSTEIREKFGSGDIVVCDFPLNDFNHQSSRINGAPYQYGIINIDHHLPFKEMERFISSGNIAANFVRNAASPLPENCSVVLNHTDCDSIISSLIMRGYLPPLEIFEKAVIAADHTGAEDKIADLLQALDPLADMEKSIRNLGKLLANEPLDPDCEALFEKRMRDRNRAAEIVSAGNYEIRDSLAIVQITGERISGELFLPHFNNACLLATFRKLSDHKNEVRLRLCAKAPEGFSLHNVAIQNFDTGYGGRWNAGSNRRSNGTELSPARYAELLSLALNAALSELRA